MGGSHLFDAEDMLSSSGSDIPHFHSPAYAGSYPKLLEIITLNSSSTHPKCPWIELEENLPFSFLVSTQV